MINYPNDKGWLNNCIISFASCYPTLLSLLCLHPTKLLASRWIHWTLKANLMKSVFKWHWKPLLAMVSRRMVSPGCLFERWLLLFRLNEVHSVLGSMVVRHGRKHMSTRRLLYLHRKEHLLMGLRKWAIMVFHHMPQQFWGLLLVSAGCIDSILTIQIWKPSGQQVWRSAVHNLSTLQLSVVSMMC